MFKKYLWIVGLMASFFVTTHSAANTMTAAIAYVTGTGTYANGGVYVFFDRAISSCSDSNRIDLNSSHAARNQVLSIAMTAFTSGKAVRIHPGSCNGYYPIFGDIGDSYLFLTNEQP